MVPWVKFCRIAVIMHLLLTSENVAEKILFHLDLIIQPELSTTKGDLFDEQTFIMMIRTFNKA